MSPDEEVLMGRGSNGKRCENCGAVGVPADEELCKPCRLERDEGPEARRLYMKQLAEKGGRASQARRGAHGLDVEALPRLDGHGAAKRWLSALAEGVASGRVSRGLSGEVRKVLKMWMAAHKAEVTDEVVQEIREELEELRRKVEAQDEPWR